METRFRHGIESPPTLADLGLNFSFDRLAPTYCRKTGEAENDKGEGAGFGYDNDIPNIERDGVVGQ